MGEAIRLLWGVEALQVRGQLVAEVGHHPRAAPRRGRARQGALEDMDASGELVGIFGGSGFYRFLHDVEEVPLATPYGPPSAPIRIGSVEGRQVAFLPRHGDEHTLPPHRINYRANLWALKQVGVTRVIGPCACGALQPELDESVARA